MQAAINKSIAATARPYYLPNDNEVEVFGAAYRRGLPVMLKGPTGSGKTRFVEHMAHTLGVPLVTIACHEDITAADLVGRYLLTGGETVWADGPLTKSVRQGAICYLDEIVEARADSIVVLHPLADHRRQLNIERLGETLHAPDAFMLVVSYNPGYQSVLKDLKPSTRQRMIGIEMHYPVAEKEIEILVQESAIDRQRAADLVRLANAIRKLDASSLSEVSSTRTLVSAAQLIKEGMAPRAAATAAIVLPLTDDRDISQGLVEIIATYLPG
jgi:nitric oxide reductase NorQ protein